MSRSVEFKRLAYDYACLAREAALSARVALLCAAIALSSCADPAPHCYKNDRTKLEQCTPGATP